MILEGKVYQWIERPIYRKWKSRKKIIRLSVFLMSKWMEFMMKIRILSSIAGSVNPELSLQQTLCSEKPLKFKFD
ncbi:MAG: hypothetical protein D6732_26550 [Methanobacteriota archaeon]|nr:MAG: hypothetical protein D6732_26550 [Euryarchaeota archaeon]